MSVTIPDDILMTTRMTERELKQEIAVMLFAQERLTLGQASKLAEMKQDAFQHILGSRKIPPHYGVEDFKQDIENLRAERREVSSL